VSYAKELGLDMAKFEPCVNNDETLQRVVTDTNEGRQVGVTGTPTFFINGVRITPRETQTLDLAIAYELKKAGRIK
jgi:protein-disulfide isomerase